MELSFKDKRILVTGAGRGIGRAVALALAKKGCHVYALSRTKETLDTLVEECPNIKPLTVDVSDWTETRKVLETLEELDGLVNNAGILSAQCPALDTTKEEIDKLLDTNLFSAINCIQVIGKKMVKAGKSGSIVNVSSCASTQPGKNLLPYCLSKAGMDLVTKQFALELGPYNIRVNAVNPTLVLTDMAKIRIQEIPKVEETITSRTPLGRLPEVEEIVGPILYFLSDLSSSVTGSAHVIDGGRMSVFKY